MSIVRARPRTLFTFLWAVLFFAAGPVLYVLVDDLDVVRKLIVLYGGGAMAVVGAYLLLFMALTRRTVIRGHVDGLTVFRPVWLPGQPMIERIRGDMRGAELVAPPPVPGIRMPTTGRWYQIQVPAYTNVWMTVGPPGETIRVRVVQEMIEQDYMDRFDEWKQLVADHQASERA